MITKLSIISLITSFFSICINLLELCSVSEVSGYNKQSLTENEARLPKTKKDFQKLATSKITLRNKISWTDFFEERRLFVRLVSDPDRSRGSPEFYNFFHFTVCQDDWLRVEMNFSPISDIRPVLLKAPKRLVF